MTLEERGAYIVLLAHQWDAGSVPNSAEERRRILSCSRACEKKIWLKLSSKFVHVDGRYQNTRLEEERQKQAEYRRRQSDRGKASAAAKVNAGSTEPQPGAVAVRLQPEVNSASASAFAIKEQEQQPPSRPLVSGESNPRTWGKIHGEHVPGFCDWVCLPEFLFAEFVRKSRGPEYVKGWAAAVRVRHQGQPIGDNLKFWRARWSESHPESAAAPEKKPFSIQDVLDKEAARKAGRAS